MPWNPPVTMSRQDRSEVRSEVTNLRQQVLTEVNKMMKRDTLSELTVLRNKVAALYPPLTNLSTLMDSVGNLVSQVEKLGLQTASLRPETCKQAKLLTDKVEQSMRSIVEDHYGAKYATRRVISSAQDVLDFIADNLDKDEQWRSQAADLLRRTMEEEV